MQDKHRSRRCQALTTVGARFWGNWFDGRGLLRVKVYEFAIYIDRQQAQVSEISKVLKRRGLKALSGTDFYRKLRSSRDIDMSLMLKASRTLPLKAVSSEYEKILKRRLELVGGNSSDPALTCFISSLEDQNIPSRLKTEDGCVKKGTIITFKKYKDGHLKTFADDVELGEVQSSKLCAALFDLYLGDQPVSKSAKFLAGRRVADFVIEEGQTPLKNRGLVKAERFSNPEVDCGPGGCCRVPNQLDCTGSFCGFPQIDLGHLGSIVKRAEELGCGRL